MANIITSFRILCSIVLLFVAPFSPAFYVFYLLAGFSDMIDGTVARKTNAVSEFGSKLDTIADFILLVVCLIKIIPVFTIPLWLIVWIVLIALIKIMSVIFRSITKKNLVVEHTIMNKITGFLLFVLPLTLTFIDLQYGAIIVCIVATFTAIQDLFFLKKDSTL